MGFTIPHSFCKMHGNLAKQLIFPLKQKSKMYEHKKLRPLKMCIIDVYISLEVVNSEKKVIIRPDRSMKTNTILHKLSGKLGTEYVKKQKCVQSPLFNFVNKSLSDKKTKQKQECLQHKSVHSFNDLI